MDEINLIPLLRGVPEFCPRLIELAWKVAKEDGTFDVEKATFYAKEIMDATKEAEAYSRDTKEIVECLRKMARSKS